VITFGCASNCGIAADMQQTYRVIITSYAGSLDVQLEVNCVSPLALMCLHIVISL
jgi:hypothetical protein